jgi:hypothetical protein
MQPRTIALLQDSLDEDFQWRIKELSNFRTSIPSDVGSAQNALIRAGITLLYAHWEGFVRFATTQYYKFVGYQSLKVGELTPCLVGLLAAGLVEELQATNRASRKSALIVLLYERFGREAVWPSKAPIKTSNLLFDVFEDACAILGIPSSDFEINRELIDKQLVARRNTIAHGNYLDVDYKTFNEELFHKITDILSKFKEKVVQSAVDQKYLH